MQMTQLIFRQTWFLYIVLIIMLFTLVPGSLTPVTLLFGSHQFAT